MRVQIGGGVFLKSEISLWGLTEYSNTDNSHLPGLESTVELGDLLLIAGLEATLEMGTLSFGSSFLPDTAYTFADCRRMLSRNRKKYYRCGRVRFRFCCDVD